MSKYELRRLAITKGHALRKVKNLTYDYQKAYERKVGIELYRSLIIAFGQVYRIKVQDLELYNRTEKYHQYHKYE